MINMIIYHGQHDRLKYIISQYNRLFLYYILNDCEIMVNDHVYIFDDCLYYIIWFFTIIKTILVQIIMTF